MAAFLPELEKKQKWNSVHDISRYVEVLKPTQCLLFDLLFLTAENCKHNGDRIYRLSRLNERFLMHVQK